VDSWFGEPFPERETWKPWEFRYFWRRATSEPVEPRVRSRVKVAETVEVGVVQTFVPPESLLIEAIVIDPK